MSHEPEQHHKKYEIEVDRTQKFPCKHKEINGAQLRKLASIPENVEIFHVVHGKKDDPVGNHTEVHLSHEHVNHFSTQPSGSQAG